MDAVTTPTGPNASYSYDKNGNLLTKNDAAGMTSYVYNKANQLISMSSPGKSVTFGYDGNGNQTSKTENTNIITSYDFNFDGRLINITNPDSSTVTFAYDGDGRRISKTAAGVTTKYYYDLKSVAKETDGSGVVQADYVYGVNGSPVSMTRGGVTYNYVFNPHGDTVALVDSTEAVMATYSYDPWGVVSTTSTIINPFQYVGRFGVFHDKETGLDLMGYRYYNSGVGRFVSPDLHPGFAEKPVTHNFYIYVVDNPINFIDPEGFREAEGAYGEKDPDDKRVERRTLLKENLAERSGNYPKVKGTKDFLHGSNRKPMYAHPAPAQPLTKEDLEWSIITAGTAFVFAVTVIPAAVEAISFGAGYLSYRLPNLVRTSGNTSKPYMPTPLAGDNMSSRLSRTTEGAGQADKNFVEMMEPNEAARYQRYWEQNYNDTFKGELNTRQRQYTTPGTRSIVDQKINEKTGELYSRETIYDKYGRRIGNNDYTDHGRPDVPEHTIPHYHPNPWYNPTQHGPATPGLHPDTPF